MEQGVLPVYSLQTSQIFSYSVSGKRRATFQRSCENLMEHVVPSTSKCNYYVGENIPSYTKKNFLYYDLYNPCSVFLLVVGRLGGPQSPSSRLLIMRPLHNCEIK